MKNSVKTLVSALFACIILETPLCRADRIPTDNPWADDGCGDGTYCLTGTCCGTDTCCVIHDCCGGECCSGVCTGSSCLPTKLIIMGAVFAVIGLALIILQCYIKCRNGLGKPRIDRQRMGSQGQDLLTDSESISR